MKIKYFKNLFRRRPEIIKIIDPKIGLSDEELKQLEEDIGKIFPNVIRHGSTRRGRRQFGKIVSLQPTLKHREGLSWLLDDKEK